MLRLLERSRIRDGRNVRDMLEKLDMLSINQMLAQVKLLEAWKAIKDENYPIHMKKKKKAQQHPKKKRK